MACYSGAGSATAYEDLLWLEDQREVMKYAVYENDEKTARSCAGGVRRFISDWLLRLADERMAREKARLDEAQARYGDQMASLGALKTLLPYHMESSLAMAIRNGVVPTSISRI